MKRKYRQVKGQQNTQQLATKCRMFRLVITTERDILRVASERTYGDEKLDDAISIFTKPILSTTEVI